MKLIKNSICIVFLVFFGTLEAFSQDGWSFYKEGSKLMIEEKYEDAILTLKKGVEMNDESVSINFYGLAYCHYELGEYDEANSFIKESLRTELTNDAKVNSVIYWLNGRIAEAEGNSKLELNSYEKSLLYEPFDNELKTTLGLALIEHNQLNRAILILTEVIKSKPSAYAFCNRASAYIKAKKFGLGKTDLKESLKLDNKNPFLFENYFLYYKGIGKLKKACESLNEALSLNMNDYGIEKDTRRLIKHKTRFCIER